MHVKFSEDTNLGVWEGKTAGRKGLIGLHEIQHGRRPSPILGSQSPAGLQAGAGGDREHLWGTALGTGRQRAELGPAVPLGSDEGQQHLGWCKQDMAPRVREGQGLLLLLSTCQTSSGYCSRFWASIRGRTSINMAKFSKQTARHS